MTEETLNGKLLAIRAIIEGLLKANDIGGMVFLHMPGYMEIFSEMAPSYSCLQTQRDEEGNLMAVRIRSKLADYGGDVQAQKRDLAATANLVSMLAQSLAWNAAEMLALSRVVDKAVNAEHGDMMAVTAPKGSVQ